MLNKNLTVNADDIYASDLNLYGNNKSDGGDQFELVAGKGIDITESVNSEGKKVYTITKIPPITDFEVAYKYGYNFDGKTIRFVRFEYSVGGSFYINFNNGYKLHISAGGGIDASAFNPYYQVWEKVYNNEEEIPFTYYFHSGKGTFGDDCTIEGIYQGDADCKEENRISPEVLTANTYVKFDDPETTII